MRRFDMRRVWRFNVWCVRNLDLVKCLHDLAFPFHPIESRKPSHSNSREIGVRLPVSPSAVTKVPECCCRVARVGDLSVNRDESGASLSNCSTGTRVSRKIARRGAKDYIVHETVETTESAFELIGERVVRRKHKPASHLHTDSIRPIFDVTECSRVPGVVTHRGGVLAQPSIGVEEVYGVPASKREQRRITLMTKRVRRKEEA